MVTVPLRLTLLPAVTSNDRHRAATMSVTRPVDDDGCRTHLRSGWCQGRDIAMVKCTSAVYLQESENPLVARAAGSIMPQWRRHGRKSHFRAAAAPCVSLGIPGTERPVANSPQLRRPHNALG